MGLRGPILLRLRKCAPCGFRYPDCANPETTLILSSTDRFGCSPCRPAPTGMVMKLRPSGSKKNLRFFPVGNSGYSEHLAECVALVITFSRILKPYTSRASRAPHVPKVSMKVKYFVKRSDGMQLFQLLSN